MKRPHYEELAVMQSQCNCINCWYWDEDADIGFPGCVYAGSIEIKKTDSGFPVSCNQFRKH